MTTVLEAAATLLIQEGWEPGAAAAACEAAYSKGSEDAGAAPPGRVTWVANRARKAAGAGAEPQPKRPKANGGGPSAPASTPTSAGRWPDPSSPYMSRRERLAQQRAEKQAADRAARPKEPIERGPVTRIIAGPRGRFTDEQLAGIERVADAWPGYWLVVFEGDGYRDADQVASMASAKQVVGHFKCAFPDAEIEWLVREE
jgi:hypothetical protein